MAGLLEDELELLRAGAAAGGVRLTGSQEVILSSFLDLLLVWSRRYRLVGTRDRSVLITHHLADSLVPAGVLGDQGSIIDIGSGAGLPGIPLAVVRPDLRFVLLDSRRVPCGFMREAVRRLGLANVGVREARVEAVAGELESSGGEFDATISRAWANLSPFLQVSARLLKAGGVAVAMKGPGLERELAACGEELDLFERSDDTEYSLPGKLGPRRLLAIFRYRGRDSS